MLSDGYLALILVVVVGSVGAYSLLFARRHLQMLSMPGTKCLAPLYCSRPKDTSTRESWRCPPLRCPPCVHESSRIAHARQVLRIRVSRCPSKPFRSPTGKRRGRASNQRRHDFSPSLGPSHPCRCQSTAVRDHCQASLNSAQAYSRVLINRRGVGSFGVDPLSVLAGRNLPRQPCRRCRGRRL